MPSVTFSIPDKVKSEMKEFPWVNWSKLAREEFLKQEEKTALLDELDELTKDSTLTDADCERLGKLVKKGIRRRLERGD